MRRRFLLHMRFGEPRQAPSGDAQALRHQPIHSRRHARDRRDSRERGRCQGLRSHRRPPGQGQGNHRGQAVRGRVRRIGGETAVSGDLRIRSGFALPRQGCSPGDVYARSLCGLHRFDRRTHRARRGPLQRITVRKGGRPQAGGRSRIGPHGGLHRPLHVWQETRRHPPRLRRHPDGRHRVRGIPADRHRASGSVPRSRKEGRSGDRDLLAVHGGFRHIRIRGFAGRRGCRRRQRCEDRHRPGRRDTRQIDDRGGREGVQEDGRGALLLPRSRGEGLDAQVPSGRDVRAHREPGPVRRVRHIRRHPAQGRDERGEEDHRGQQRPRRPDTRFRGREPPRRRRRSAQVPGEVTSSSTIRRTPGPCRRGRRP